MGLPGIPCATITVGSQGLCVTFPGGASVCVQLQSPRIPSPAETARALLAQVNTALAPLAPFFAVYNCLAAVPDIVTNPSEFITAFEKMAAMAPAASVPVMVGKIIDLLIAYLQGIDAQLRAMIKALQAVAAAATRAAKLQNPRLMLSVDCATGQIALSMANVNAGGAPLNTLIAIVNQLTNPLGLPQIPSLADLGPDPTAALVPLADAITVLQDLRHAFP